MIETSVCHYNVAKVDIRLLTLNEILNCHMRGRVGDRMLHEYMVSNTLVVSQNS